MQTNEQSAGAVSRSPPTPPPLAPHYVTAPAMLVVGLRQRHAVPVVATNIIAQWRGFMARSAAIEYITGATPLGISLQCNGNSAEGGFHEGGFDYICAFEVSRFFRIPQGLTELRIAARPYAVFAHDGPVAELGATYRAIWDQWLPAHAAQAAVDEGAVLERFSENFDVEGRGGVAIWVPLKPGSAPA